MTRYELDLLRTVQSDLIRAQALINRLLERSNAEHTAEDTYQSALEEKHSNGGDHGNKFRPI